MRKMVAAVLLAGGLVTGISGVAIAAESGNYWGASAKDCTEYLSDKGYDVGPMVETACLAGEHGDGKRCVRELKEGGVDHAVHRTDACVLADRPS
jgi:hypothetical protein